MKKLLLILVAFVCCLSLFTQDALLIYRQNYAKPLLVALKDITNITYEDAEQVMTLEQWNITSESETTVIDSLVFVDLETLETNEYAHFVCPDDHHPHMIDLGLPSGVLWSCCNVDASAPEEYGGYYAWGETEEKEVYGYDTYKYYDRETHENIHIGDDIAGTEYDVAHMKWGGSWRMPTIDQINELFDNCKWTLTTLNGVYGSLVMGPNGATVFLPASGSRDGEGLHWKGTDGYYWSSSLYSTGEKYSYALYFNSYETEYCLPGRVDGCSVRPVIAPVKPKDDCPVAEAIDLGLPSGTRWASWNVGASAPEEYGGYFAWGETEEKDYFDWSTYTHCDGTQETCHYIGDDIAGTEYDVAHVKWGGSWTMPTHEQTEELCYNCSWSWTTQNGVNGQLVTGPNGNTIFLPANGNFWWRYLDQLGSKGKYWSSSLVTGGEGYAYDIGFYSVSWVVGSMDRRSYGQAVRAVCPSTPPSSTNITFADTAVKAICVANWDTNKDGELSIQEAAAVKNLGTVFYEKQGISSFNELQYFTGLTIIEEEAFRECSLESVSIPASVKTIGEKAFMQCPNLSNVTLPEGVTWIDEEAFSACALTSIILPESLIRLGEQALEENPLISVTLPRNVAYLGNSDEDDLYGGVFDYCYSLKEVNVVESNKTYASINGVLTTKDKNLLLFFPYAKGDGYKVPEGIEQIHYDAFNECKNTSVTLPSTLKAFYTDEDEENYSAFSNNFDLRTVRAKMKVPFECGYYSFSDETYSSGTLHVPQGTKTLYETTAGWSRFQNVVEDENYCPVAEAIDLGLPSGTRWASWNVGASAPEEYGGYYAWGETEEKDYYDVGTYKYFNSETNEYIHIGDDIAGTEYDVAHVKWGGLWRMPSFDQIKELLDNCTRSWTQQNGVNGTLVTGPNGNTIFLPAACYRRYDSLYNERESGYWSSSLHPYNEYYAYFLYFSSYGWDRDCSGRIDGRSVRPVMEPVEPEKPKIDNQCLKMTTTAPGENVWDYQLNYTLPQPLQAGKTYNVSITAKATNGLESVPFWPCDAQGAELYTGFRGLPADGDMTTLWLTFTAEADYKYFAFALGKLDGDFFLDDFVVTEAGSDINLVANGNFDEEVVLKDVGWQEDGNVPGNTWWKYSWINFTVGMETLNRESFTIEWVDQLTNGEMAEGGSMENFIVLEPGKPYLPGTPIPGGPDGKNCIKITSIDNPTNEWDTQFFIYTPDKAWTAGEYYKISFWYRASQDADCWTQCNDAPGYYLHWEILPSNPKFTTEWQYYEAHGTIPDKGDGMHTIAFVLNVSDVSTDYYFADIHWWSMEKRFESASY